VTIGEELLGEPEADNSVAAAVGVDDEHLLRASSGAEAEARAGSSPLR
jgi:2-hydroxychromene-2-carboxylate isomerase